MRMRSFILALLAGFFVSVSTASAGEIEARVVIAEQQIHISFDGIETYVWPVSTGRPGHKTPMGTFTVKRMDAKHHSVWYHHASMPFAVFFDDRRAVHGIPKSEEAALGTRASHGCVRLQTENARLFFHLVSINGKDHTTIIIQ